MLHKYSDYISNINEGSSKRPQVLYWNSQVEKILNNEWTELILNVTPVVSIL